MKEKYIEECKIIYQNCLYTAEAHHQVALVAKRHALWLEIIPAICAALSGTLVSANILSHSVLIVTVVSSVIVAVSAVLNPNKTYQSHLEAGKNFTTLKHDARLLYQATSKKLSDEAFTLAVENLHQKYNELLKTAPPTDEESFAKAQAIVQKGTHSPDVDANGELKI